MNDQDKLGKDELVEQMNKIIGELRGLTKEYQGQFEYSFIFTAFDKNGKYELGAHEYNIITPSNLDKYSDTLIAVKDNMMEVGRFELVKNLPEFKVVCTCDDLSPETMGLLKKNGGDWPLYGKGYIVKAKRPSNTGKGYSFEISDLNGVPLKPPYPYNGYHSARFALADYTKLN